MTTSGTTPSLEEDIKLELIGSASMSARRNRPMWLIVLGLALVAVATIFSLYSFYLIGDAAATLHRSSRRYDGIKKEVDALRAFQSADAANAERFRPDPRAVSKLEELGARCGLAVVVADESDRTTTKANKIKRKLSITLNAQTAEATIRFLQQAPQEVIGLELAELRLTPGKMTTQDRKNTWNATLVFSRWEDATTPNR